MKKAGASGHKEINRTNLTVAEMEAALDREVVRKQIEMIRFRNTYQAFDERAKISIEGGEGILRIVWSCDGFEAELAVDFVKGEYKISSAENK